MADFAHLRVHSAYTLSQGASKIGSLVERSRTLGIPAIAMVDRNNLFGALEFSKAASGTGIQPIIGCQLSIEYGEAKHGSVSFLAQSEEGYRNLCALLRSATDPRVGKDGVEAARDHPCIDLATLAARSEGLILLTGGGDDGLLPQIAAKSPEAAASMFRDLLEVMGDRLYVEICRAGPPSSAEAAIEDTLLDLAYGAAGDVACRDGVLRHDAPLVATSEVWYSTKDRHDAWLLLKAVESKSQVTMDGEEIIETGLTAGLRHHMRTSEEMETLFADLPEAFTNAANVARRCSFMVKGRAPILPPFACEGGRTEGQELREQSLRGLDARLEKAGIGDDKRAAYDTRIAYELDVIENMGFPGYFLIVADFIQWAKARDIPVGPGRGSGAGSVVAWALTITDLDPLDYGLLFERFLNPERVSMPDFDIDFCEDQRDDVIAYVRGRYGSDKVAMISTFGEIKSKMALSDMQRVINHNQLGMVHFGEVKQLTKLVPKKVDAAEPMSLEEAYQTQAFRDRVDESPKLTVLYQQARKVEGLLRSSGTHAAGIVISDRPLEDLVPVSWDAKKSMPVAGYNMKGIEAAGLVKFDFLGLTTLSVMKEALRNIRDFHGVEVDLSMIDKHEPEVYVRFAKGSTTGVFQFEGGGMRNALRQVKPTRLEDLIAVNALYRPGPMEFIKDYAACKNGEATAHYPQPEEKTKPFLEETFGIMVYQEQVMQVAQASAGYSLGSADILRRAMGKKIRAEMEKQRKIFIHGDEKSAIPGAVKLGMDATVADQLFDDIAKFADYGFNKSHAAAYAWIAYQTMWLKVHYPAAFFSALMTYNTDKPEKLALIKDELDELSIPLLSPDVNHSHGRFLPEESANGTGGYAVRFGLSGIKQISGAAADLSGDRAKNGVYKNLEDFHKRVGGRFNTAQMGKLSEAGAFDTMSRSRRQAASVVGWLNGRKDKSPIGQSDMFGGAAAVPIPDEILDVAEWGDVADREYKAVGFYYSRHPIDPFVPRLYAAGIRRRSSFHDWMAEKSLESMENRKVCVLVDDVRMGVTSTGKPKLSAFVSEKGDTYQISCYDNWQTGFKVENFRAVLEGAKASRKPVVFVASLAYDAAKDTVWVRGRGVWAVDEFLKDIRGDIAIVMSASHARPNVAEQRRLTLADTNVQEGTITATEADAERRVVRMEMLQKRILGLVDYLTTEQQCVAPEGVQIRIESLGGEVMLPGRYRFGSAAEGCVKSWQGVVSVREFVSSAAPVAKARQRPDYDDDEEQEDHNQSGRRVRAS